MHLFADHPGQTVAVLDAATGEIRSAQVFAAVLGASNDTDAWATWQQTASDWVGSIIATLAIIGGLAARTRAQHLRPSAAFAVVALCRSA